MQYPTNLAYSKIKDIKDSQWFHVEYGLFPLKARFFFTFARERSTRDDNKNFWLIITWTKRLDPKQGKFQGFFKLKTLKKEDQMKIKIYVLKVLS